MTSRRLIIFLLCIVILMVCQTTELFAQPGDPPKPNENVPITGLEYLLGGGILYGIRSLLKARKKQSD
jgi:hypothetical protein